MDFLKCIRVPFTAFLDFFAFAFLHIYTIQYVHNFGVPKFVFLLSTVFFTFLFLFIHRNKFCIPKTERAFHSHFPTPFPTPIFHQRRASPHSPPLLVTSYPLGGGQPAVWGNKSFRNKTIFSGLRMFVKLASFRGLRT